MRERRLATVLLWGALNANELQRSVGDASALSADEIAQLAGVVFKDVSTAAGEHGLLQILGEGHLTDLVYVHVIAQVLGFAMRMRAHARAHAGLIRHKRCACVRAECGCSCCSVRA